MKLKKIGILVMTLALSLGSATTMLPMLQTRNQI